MNVFDYLFYNSKHEKKQFIIGTKETIDYDEIYFNSLKLASYIRKNYGLNQYMIILMPNSIFFITVYLAILKSGNVCIPLNPKIENVNLQYIIKNCEVKLGFTLRCNQNQFKKNQVTLICEDEYKNLINQYQPMHEEVFDEKNLAEIIFTSGSTSIPKGVMITHKNIIANTYSILEYLNLTSNDVMEVVLPFYYCYGLSLLHIHIRVGGSIVLNNTFVFTGTVVSDFKKYFCTGFAGVPSHFHILLRNSKALKETQFPNLRYVTSAGGKLQTSTIKKFIDTFPNINFFSMYGQTEATARLSYLPPELIIEKPESIGKGLSGVELKVINKKGQEVKPGEIGEIIAKGDNIMMGYFNNNIETQKVIKNNWLYTGDMATIDKEGFIYIKHRKNDIIKVRGRRICIKEIEDTIMLLPNVIACNVFVANNTILGELIKSIIIVEDIENHDLTKRKIKEHCIKYLSTYKIPTLVDFYDKNYLDSSGKKFYI